MIQIGAALYNTPIHGYFHFSISPACFCATMNALGSYNKNACARLRIDSRPVHINYIPANARFQTMMQSNLREAFSFGNDGKSLLNVPGTRCTFTSCFVAEKYERDTRGKRLDKIKGKYGDTLEFSMFSYD